MFEPGTSVRRITLTKCARPDITDLDEFNKTISGSSPINFEKDAQLFDESFDFRQKGTVPGFSDEAHS